MRLRHLTAAFAVATVALAATACGDDDDGGDEPKAPVATDAEFEAGTTMAKLNDAGSIKIGVKVDQPNVGFVNPETGEHEGLDVEMGKIVAAQLGIEPESIEWIETISDNREIFIDDGKVDIVIASYSITDERKELVDFAGPYYVTGQQLLVAKDNDDINGPDDLDGKSVCSVKGSTSLDTVKEDYGADPKPFDGYQQCVTQVQNGSIDAATTDGAILAGYAANDPDELKVVGEPFSTEKYGIGLKKGDDAFRSWLNDTIEASYQDGSWKKAFEDTLAASGIDTPEPPPVERYGNDK